MDIVILLAVLSRRMKNPTTVIITATCGRILVVVFGSSYWFIGHSICYFIITMIFGAAMVEDLVPTVKKNVDQRELFTRRKIIIFLLNNCRIRERGYTCFH